VSEKREREQEREGNKRKKQGESVKERWSKTERRESRMF
jgi:hypothetical protein